MHPELIKTRKLIARPVYLHPLRPFSPPRLPRNAAAPDRFLPPCTSDRYDDQVERDFVSHFLLGREGKRRNGKTRLVLRKATRKIRRNRLEVLLEKVSLARSRSSSGAEVSRGPLPQMRSRNPNRPLRCITSPIPNKGRRLHALPFPKCIPAAESLPATHLSIVTG